MHFEFRNYQLLKTKQCLKNKLLLFSNGANQNSQNWLTIEQGLVNSKLKYYKIYNKIALKVLKHSRYRNIQQMVQGTFFFLKFNETITQSFITKKKLFKNLESIFFKLLSLKLNNKIYSIAQIKTIKSLKYKNNIALLYQFFLANLKCQYTLLFNKKSRNNVI